MRVRRRTEFTLVLIANSAFHVGQGSTELGPDQILATDTAGNHHVPGTSLAGALRARLHDADIGAVERLFGFVGPQDQGHASRVIVGDATVAMPQGGSPQILTGVAIDRISGTAADRFLYDRVVLPRGTTLTAVLTVEDEHVDEHLQHGVHATTLLRMLAGITPRHDHGRGAPLRLGAGTTRGLGEFGLDRDASTIRVIAMDGPGIIDALYAPQDAGPLAEQLQPIEEPDTGPGALEPSGMVSIEVRFRARGPLMVRGDHPSVVDAVPRFAKDHDVWTPVIPATTIKGVLRQAAERIIATLLEVDVADPVADDDPRLLLEQQDLPLVRTIFGSAKGPASTDEDGTRGLLHLNDLLAQSKEHRLTNERFERLLEGDTSGPVGFERGVHVALDRFTGGAAEHLLYDVLEPHGVRWPAMQLQVRLPSWEDHDAVAGLGLLFLVLRELQAGVHAIGAFAERGHGDIEVDAITVRGVDAGSLQPPADVVAPAVPDGWDVPDNLWRMTAAAWQRYFQTEGADR